MAYAPQTWNNDDPTTPLSAARLSHMEDGIAAGQPRWEQPSPFGAAFRPSVDLRMSDYDTSSGATDHQPAFQAAVDAAKAIIEGGTASYVRVICDTRKPYTLASAPTIGPEGQNSQVHLPGTTVNTGCIELVGMPAMPGAYIGFGSGSWQGTVIESTAAAPAFTAANGIASMFGGPASFSTSARVAGTISFATRNITFRQANPAIAGVDAGWLHGFWAKGHLGFDTDHYAALAFPYTVAQMVAPATSQQAIPLITPLIGCYYGSQVDTLSIVGWYCGPVLGEALNAKEIRVFATNLCLSLDRANESSHIEKLYDWDNGNGIGTCGPGTAPTSPGATGLASNATNGVPSATKIVNWQNQLAAASEPAALQRTYDLLDTGGLTFIEGTMYMNQGGSGGGVRVRSAIILGAGGSTTGLANSRIVDGFRKQGALTFNPATYAASGVANRNMFARPTVLMFAGSVITTAVVDGVTLPFTTVVPLGPNSTYTLTFTGTPSGIAVVS